MPSGFVFSKLVPVPLEHRGGSDWPRVVAFLHLNYAGTRVKGVHVVAARKDWKRRSPFAIWVAT